MKTEFLFRLFQIPGSGKARIHAEVYSSDWQDFLASNSSILDTWVLDRFKILLRLRRVPTRDKVLIFLHMLGIDNTGHATKPRSP
jgi:phosphatidylinositol glycan class N